MIIFSIIFRMLWSLSIGLPFFALGLILFLLFDIFSPKSDSGYRILNAMYKWGSCYWFKGVRMETDDFEIDIKKRRAGSN